MALACPTSLPVFVPPGVRVFKVGHNPSPFHLGTQLLRCASRRAGLHYGGEARLRSPLRGRIPRRRSPPRQGPEGPLDLVPFASPR